MLRVYPRISQRLKGWLEPKYSQAQFLPDINCLILPGQNKSINRGLPNLSVIFASCLLPFIHLAKSHSASLQLLPWLVSLLIRSPICCQVTFLSRALGLSQDDEAFDIPYRSFPSRYRQRLDVAPSRERDPALPLPGPDRI